MILLVQKAEQLLSLGKRRFFPQCLLPGLGSFPAVEEQSRRNRVYTRCILYSRATMPLPEQREK